MPPSRARHGSPAGVRAGTALAGVRTQLRRILGPAGVIDDPDELATYACDGLTAYAATPGVVVLPETTGQVRDVVRACAGAGVPFVARGSGTGLSGGALPRTDGVLIALSRMRRIRRLDAANLRAVVEPGVTNLAITQAAEPFGLYYAPDPSSQQVCSIGGNVAENSGGAHCLKYGFTTNHVLGVELVTPEGAVVRLGSSTPVSPGYDLLGVVVGSEGTLGIVTEVTVRLLAKPAAVCTLLAGFPSIAHAGEAVSAIIAAGVVPAAVEMMDALAIEAAEAAVACGYPPGAGAVLIVELDGPVGEVDEEVERVRELCATHAAFALRLASDAAERAQVWRGRKSAFAAVGRISPAFLIQDGVVPRSSLAEVLQAIEGVARSAGVRVANVFHAGDGNLHPLVLFDPRVPGGAERAELASGQILDLCVAHGGSITGEHGVGIDKMAAMPKMFSADDLDTMGVLRCAFDPAGLCNPGKAFPTPRLCGEVPGRRSGVHPLVAAGVAEQF